MNEIRRTRTVGRASRSVTLCLALTASALIGLHEPAHGQELTCGSVLRGSLAPETAEEFRFPADAGDVVSIVLVKTDGISTFTPVYDLSVPGSGSDTVIATEARGLNEYELPTSGEYTLLVQAVGTTDNDYFLGIEWLHPESMRCTDAELVPGSRLERGLGDGIQDILELTVEKGQRFGLTLEKTGGEERFLPQVEVFGPSPDAGPGETLGTGFHTVDADRSGTYVLRVHQNFPPDRNNAYHNERGTYAISLSLSGPLVRGDANSDGGVDISDAITTLGRLFLARPGELPCEKSADTDDSGDLDLTDAVALLSYLFLAGLPPSRPFPECGPDETEDSLACSRPACG